MLHKNIPNILSIFRILMSPLFILFMIQDDPYYRIVSFFLIVIVSITDFLDGYYARTFNLITNLGKYLDPIADKLFILTVFFTLHFLLPDYIHIWMLVLIVLRDVFVTVLRSIFHRQNLTFNTSRFAKSKTLIQLISIHCIVLLLILDEFYLLEVNFMMVYYLMLLCTLLTLISGFNYFHQYYFLKNNEKV